MKKEVRVVHDYYYGDECVFTLGYVNRLKAASPLKLHNHGNMMEFVYVVKGEQTYQVDSQGYCVRSGKVFFTGPYETHTTGSHPEEVSEIYYLIIDLQLLEKMGVFLTSEEYSYICNMWKNKKQRIFTPVSGLLGALKRLMSCFDNHDLYFDSCVRNALSETVIALSRPHKTETEYSLEKIKNSLQYIHSHLDETIRVSMLADMDYLSVSAYSKAFTQAIGMPPGEYILKCKIEKAKELLEKTDLSVTDIAYKFGFSSSQYFATVFKRFSVETPTEYRRMAKL